MADSPHPRSRRHPHQEPKVFEHRRVRINRPGREKRRSYAHHHELDLGSSRRRRQSAKEARDAFRVKKVKVNGLGTAAASGGDIVAGEDEVCRASVGAEADDSADLFEVG